MILNIYLFSLPFAVFLAAVLSCYQWWVYSSTRSKARMEKWRADNHFSVGIDEDEWRRAIASNAHDALMSLWLLPLSVAWPLILPAAVFIFVRGAVRMAIKSFIGIKDDINGNFDFKGGEQE